MRFTTLAKIEKRLSEGEPSVNQSRLPEELDYKLEFKSYSKALQYNTLNDHESAIKSFDNFIVEFPGSTLREKVLYFKFDSAYKLAINSVDYKMQDRIKDAMGYYNSFMKYYDSSEYKEDLNTKFNELKQLQTT